MDLNDCSLEDSTRTLISGALLADVTGLFGHSVLTRVMLTDRARRVRVHEAVAFIKTTSLHAT